MIARNIDFPSYARRLVVAQVEVQLLLPLDESGNVVGRAIALHSMAVLQARFARQIVCSSGLATKSVARCDLAHRDPPELSCAILALRPQLALNQAEPKRPSRPRAVQRRGTRN